MADVLNFQIQQQSAVSNVHSQQSSVGLHENPTSHQATIIGMRLLSSIRPYNLSLRVFEIVAFVLFEFLAFYQYQIVCYLNTCFNDRCKFKCKVTIRSRTYVNERYLKFSFRRHVCFIFLSEHSASYQLF